MKAEGYNSLLLFSPTTERFTNELYLQHALQPAPTPVYRYEWVSRAFAAGLLENKIGVEARHAFNSKLEVRGDFYLTLDGIALRDRTKVTPNMKATAMLDYRPTKWLQVGLTLAHDRVSYNIEDIRYMSRDYMNADVFYSGTNRLFTTTWWRVSPLRPKIAAACLCHAEHSYSLALWAPRDSSFAEL